MEQSACQHCGLRLEYTRVHTGFNNTGYLYCDRDGALLVWDTFDPHYTGVVGEKHPWMLDSTDQERVEQALCPCPCGGHFGFDNPPRCSRCAAELSDLLPDRIYFADFGVRFDPSRDGLWSDSP